MLSLPHSSMRDAVLRTVLYFDVFSWPLRRSEVARFVAPSDPVGIDRVIEHLVEHKRLVAQGPLVYIPGRSEIVRRRDELAARAEQHWGSARRAASLLARFPFVRAVLISGALSKGCAAPDGDVDFFLVMAKNRVWTGRSVLQVFRRSLPEPIRESFCTNYLVGEDALPLDDRNVYTAIELATAVPMYNPRTCAGLIEQNGWARRFVPGLDWSLERAKNAPPLPRPRSVDLLEGALGDDRADRAMWRFWNGVWDVWYRGLDQQTKNSFKRRPERAANFTKNYQHRVLDAFAARLATHGVEPWPEVSTSTAAPPPTVLTPDQVGLPAGRRTEAPIDSKASAVNAAASSRWGVV